MFNIEEQLKILPENSGVYLMKDKDEKIIYVGKAKNLKNRVRQYFKSSKNHSQKVISMVSNIKSFEYIMTDTELEALILECSLIKEYRPKYNILLRDDKTYPYIKLTTNEEYPRILKVRKVLNDKCKYFGPYTNIGAVNETIDIIKSIYPIRTCSIDIKRAIEKKVRPCLNLHINRCVGPCTGNVEVNDYKKMIDEISLFLSGKEDKLIEILNEKMNECAMNLKFEEAGIYRDKIKSIEEILQKQKIDTKDVLLNQDIIAIAKIENEACIQIFFIRNGKVTGRENFIIEDVLYEEKDVILSNFIKQFYSQSEYIPKEILVEQKIDDILIINDYLISIKGQKVNLRLPLKGEKRSLIELVKKNAFEYLEKFSKNSSNKFEKINKRLIELKEILKLDKIPNRIESYDISNISGVDSIGAMVVFIEGIKDKKEYRKYKIKTVEGPNDYKSMEEVLTRRLREKENLPDLILLDGGLGQVSSVKKVLKLYDLNIPLFGMYKDDFHRTKGIINKEIDIELDKKSELFKFVSSIQEEVHNYAINYHRQLRNKSLTKSVLDDIQGVGDKRKKSLLNHFKDIDKIKNASIEEISQVEGITKPLAKKIFEFFKGN
ncbi:MAG: excinuclease ABC subunit UvrC [Peptostreptococcaceae bacterium]